MIQNVSDFVKGLIVAGGSLSLIKKDHVGAWIEIAVFLRLITQLYSQFWIHIITGVVIAIITPVVLKTIGLEKNPWSPHAFLECFLHCMARSNCTIPSVSTSLSDFPALHRTWLSSLKIKRTKKKNQIPYILFCSLVESDSRLSGLHCSKNTFALSMQIKGAFHE